MFWRRRTYLDRAAGVVGNPSSAHEEGRRAKHMLEEARTVIARLVEAQSDDIIFTSGATESNALAILGHVRALREAAGPDMPGRNNMHALYLPSAHASIVENMRLLADEGIHVEELPVKDRRVDTDALPKLIRKETVLVAMDAVCGETGLIWNAREVAEVLRKARKANEESIMLHVDASQAPLTEKITRDHFSADTLTLDAAKVTPVRGCGVLVAHRTLRLAPLYVGGGQERGLRPGTEAPVQARAFATALSTTQKKRDRFRKKAQLYREKLIAYITEHVRDVYMNGGRVQAPHILNLSLPGRDTDYLVALLDEAGFAVSTRSACETDSEEGSRAVFVLTGDKSMARATLRISWGPEISWRQLQHFAEALSSAAQFIDRGPLGKHDVNV